MTDDLVIRALAEGEARQLFTTMPGLSDAALLGRPLLDPPLDVYETVAAGGEYRPEWTWVALRGGTVVARAAFGAAPATRNRSLSTGSTTPTARRPWSCCAPHRCVPSTS